MNRPGLLQYFNWNDVGFCVGDFVSAGQNYAYTIHQKCNSIAKTFPFSFLVVSLCLYPFIFVLSYI